jgi:hypothetical protein
MEKGADIQNLLIIAIEVHCIIGRFHTVYVKGKKKREEELTCIVARRLVEVNLAFLSS